VDKFQTISWQAKAFHAAWTILGILALALLITPKFFPSETANLVSVPIQKRNPELESIAARIPKNLQVRPITQHGHTGAKRL
jgi:hypothetical protein